MSLALPGGASTPGVRLAERPTRRVTLPSSSEDIDVLCGSPDLRAATLFESGAFDYRYVVRLAEHAVEDRAFVFEAAKLLETDPPNPTLVEERNQ
jgi:hypothetical protein